MVQYNKQLLYYASLANIANLINSQPEMDSQHSPRELRRQESSCSVEWVDPRLIPGCIVSTRLLGCIYYTQSNCMLVLLCQLCTQGFCTSVLFI